MALLVILVMGAVTVLLNEAERRHASESAGSEGVGAVDHEAQIMGRTFGAFIDRPDLHDSLAVEGIDKATKHWEEGPLAMRLARVLLLEGDGETAQALALFDATIAEARKRGIEEEAAPTLRAVASLLRRSAASRAAGGDGAEPGADAGGGATEPDSAAGGETESVTTADGEGSAAAPPSLEAWPEPDADDRAEAQSRLGAVYTYAEAALAKDAAAEAQVRTEGMLVLAAVGVFVIWAGVALLGGIAAAITLAVMALNRRLRSGTGPGRTETAVLLEVFALHMVLLKGLSMLGDWLVRMRLAPGGDGGSTGDTGAVDGAASADGAAWMLAIVALSQGVALVLPFLWWNFRGGRWSTLREAAGLHARGGLVRLLAIGFVGYALAVLFVVGGFIVSAVLGAILGIERLGSPTHPVQDALAGGDLFGIVIVYALGVVVAPISEEIFFRGAFYRGLRDRLGGNGAALAAGAVGALVVTSLYFGAIHPQGLLFAPVLAGMGAGFCLVREWTGSVVPGIVAHMVNNGVIITLALVLLG